MTLDVQVTDARISAESEQLRFALDRAELRLELAGPEGSVALRGFRPHARLGRRTLEPSELRSHRVTPVQTPHGDATRLEFVFGTRGALELELAVELGRDWPGAILELSARNGGERPLRLSALDPLVWQAAAGALSLPGDPHALRVFRMGYQSWSPAVYAPLAAREPRPRLRLLRTVHRSPCAPRPRRGWQTSDTVTWLGAPGEPGLTLGFLTQKRFLAHLAVRQRRGAPVGLHARVATEERSLVPGEVCRAERLWVGLDPAGVDGLASWATRSGREMDARVPARSGSGWCSWYQYFTRVQASHVTAAAQALARLELPVDTVQIDDGFQAAVGDWLEWSPGFPDGVAPLAKEIRSHGFVAGLWLAPLLVSRASRLAREHPDWILRGRFGRKRVANLNPAWKGRVCWALDPTHPEVLDFLRQLGGSVRELGFDYLKLDFLYAGALRGRRYDRELPSAAAYRGAIQAFREGAGEDALLLGCGAPLGPSVGLFDAMRIGPDVAPAWRARGLDRLFGIRAAPSAENSLRNVLARAVLHQRLWANDPDCVLLRERDTRLGETEVRALAGAVAASGGLAVLSDDLSLLGQERLELLRRLLPPLGRAPETGPLCGELPEGLLQRLPDGTGLVYRVNLDPRARTIEIDLAGLGFGGEVYVWDVWARRPLGRRSGVLRFQSVPPRGSLLLRLAPDDGVARVLGSDLHLGAGSLEAARVTTGDGAAALELRAPGPRHGKLWLGIPGREPLVLQVGFRDALDLLVSSSGVGVEESDEMPD